MEKLKIQYEHFLTPERFATYQADAVDDDQAWEFYRWNLDLVAVVAPLASDLESCKNPKQPHAFTSALQQADNANRQRLKRVN